MTGDLSNLRKEYLKSGIVKVTLKVTQSNSFPYGLIKLLRLILLSLAQ